MAVGTTIALIKALSSGGGGGGGGAVDDVQVNGVSVVDDGVANITSADLDNSVAVSGSTPSITALSGVRYVCGECSTLTITVPASGIIDVVFTSGSTPTVLTISGATVTWAGDFDPDEIDANTTYELNIMDGFGVVGQWT